MSDSLQIANSLRLAMACAVDARRLNESGSRNAAYLAEQCLEHIIRGLATSERIHIQRADAHMLDKVLRTFPDTSEFKRELALLTWLEAYATAFRYPSPAGRIAKSPDSEKLTMAIAKLGILIERLSAHFGVDLEAVEAPAARVNPPRAP